jgi:hypothetical protein
MPKTGLFLEDDLADFRKLLSMMSGDFTKIPATCSNNVYPLCKGAGRCTQPLAMERRRQD